jgi:tRNA (adenine37-N6)-methyltransferase
VESPRSAKDYTHGLWGRSKMNWKTSGFVARPIGVVHSPAREAAGTPIQAAMAGEATGSVKLLDGCVPGLKDLNGFERIWLLNRFDRADLSGKMIVTPYLDATPRGVFSTRALSRPNSIGLSCVKLLGIEENILRIQGGSELRRSRPPAGRGRCGWRRGGSTQSHSNTEKETSDSGGKRWQWR